MYLKYTLLRQFYEKPVHRKRLLTAYIRKQVTETRMIQKFKKIYGPPTEVGIYYGDWSESNHRKFHEPFIKGKGLRELFRKAG
jgi:hypothetical protein